MVARLLEENKLTDVQYFEPYAGGAAIALALLFGEYAATIHMNDLSGPVYAFWHTVLNCTADLCSRIECVQLTMDEWHRQRAVYEGQDKADIADLGFATLFLNRTNRSGIIDGGVIGGKMQTGQWSLDVRFNRSELVQRIRRIGRYRTRIELHKLDALDFTNRVVAQAGRNVFAFYDPPYIDKGKDLYLNDYRLQDHQQLAARILQLEQPWVVTYDSAAATRYGLYEGYRRLIYELPYSANNRYGGTEVMFISDRLRLPTSWSPSHPIEMAPPNSKFPLYGKLEASRKGRRLYREP